MGLHVCEHTELMLFICLNGLRAIYYHRQQLGRVCEYHYHRQQLGRVCEYRWPWTRWWWRWEVSWSPRRRGGPACHAAGPSSDQPPAWRPPPSWCPLSGSSRPPSWCCYTSLRENRTTNIESETKLSVSVWLILHFMSFLPWSLLWQRAGPALWGGKGSMVRFTDYSQFCDSTVSGQKQPSTQPCPYRRLPLSDIRTRNGENEPSLLTDLTLFLSLFLSSSVNFSLFHSLSLSHSLAPFHISHTQNSPSHTSPNCPAPSLFTIRSVSLEISQASLSQGAWTDGFTQGCPNFRQSPFACSPAFEEAHITHQTHTQRQRSSVRSTETHLYSAGAVW